MANVKQASTAPVPPLQCEVLIVGAGVAGAAAAYHLSEAGVRDILIVDAGSQPGEATPDRRSGSAVMDNVAPTIKMMVQVYASSSKNFIAHHGRVGAKRYLDLTREGLKMQKELAKTVALESPAEQLRELGSFYLGYEDDIKELREEYELLQSLGCDDIEWYDKEMLKNVDGCSPDFHCGIYFPNDAIIDSSSYAKGLVRATVEKGAARTLFHTKVTKITVQKNTNEKNGDSTKLATALVDLESGSTIRCQHVVIASGGLFHLPELSGVYHPCYSYLVHVPVEESSKRCEYSSNFFTWGFTHDWAFTNGKIRTSGEDHFSAYKDPRSVERCDSLIKWTLERYHCQLASTDDIPKQHGVYSETPDSAPLVGSITPDNNAICYLVGCNAWGQTVLSYASSVVPGILGYKPLTESQRDNLELLSIQRFSLLSKSSSLLN